jgi:serine/threonine-protein kinase
MNEPHDPNRTVAVPSTPVRGEAPDPGHTVEHSSAVPDSLDAGLAAGFGPPRSSLGEMRPVLLKEAEGDSAHVVKPSSDAMPPKEETGDRYQLQGEIARGGMGAVLRGRDVDLGRDLAVKVLLEKYVDRPEVARRFIEEAQIGGQLQHPGVVPVYDIGRFGERPFFTMKLVKGHTLAALLAERADPAADRPRFLAIALQVCLAVAYAHAKGVIHRDLKPANVMVGAFGEVQVMDWGLAKVLAEGGTADEERASQKHQPEEGTLIRTARSSGSAGTFGTQTEVGSLLGTPAYMPPEQANGDIATLDRRADVFGLGAILCEILTGKPPYVGRSSEEVRRKAANGDLADATARLDGCAADAELTALTRTCLSPEVIDRPKDAQAVADGLTAYLDGVQERLRQAELAQAEAKARAIEEVKRRRLTLALAATVLLALTLGGGGFLYVKNERDARQAQVTRDVNEALNQATALREQARAANVGGAALLAQAREQAQRALALVHNGPADLVLKHQVTQLQAGLDEEEKDRKLITALDEARLAQAETLAEKNRFAQERAVPKFRAAFAAYGLPAGQGKPAEAAARIRQRPAAIREAIVAALDEWDVLAADPILGLQEPHRKWLQAVVEAADLDAWGRQVRAARTMKDPAQRRTALEKLAASADAAQVPARALTQLATQLSPAARVKLLRQVQTRYPADFWVNHYLALALIEVTPPEWDEAVRFLTAAIALRPDSPGCLMNLGNVLKYKGLLDEAIACYKKVIALDPKYAVAHSNLGVALYAKGQVDEALACLRQAVALAPQEAGMHNNLGVVLKAKGQLDEAIACLRKAVGIDPKVSGSHNNLGVALKARGQIDEAFASWKKAVELDPRNVEAQTSLAAYLSEFKRDYDGAIACCHRALAINPKHAMAHANLGDALAGKGQVEEAIASFKKALEFDPKLVQAHIGLGALFCDQKGDYDAAIACLQKALGCDPRSAAAHCNLGHALRLKGQLDEAIAFGRKAIELNPKDATAHSLLGAALAQKGHNNLAIASFRQAIALDPKLAAAHINLGLALQYKGQLDEAIACYKKGIALEPKHFQSHYNLGQALSAKGRVDEAIVSYRKAIELDPKHATAHHHLGLALAGKGRLDEAIACFKKAIALDPKYALAHCNLGHAFGNQGRFAQALPAFKRGHEVGSKQPGWNYPSAAWVRQAERLAAVEAKLPAFLKGEHKPSDTAERLGLLRVCQARKLHHAATRLYADAFAADAKLLEDATTALRYRAACQAALAGAGQGEDAGKLDDQQRARLRQQALDWLRAELTLLAAGEVGRSRVARILRQWCKDKDLASLRDRDALAKLPAEERAACEKLWSDVAALLKKAEGKAK